MAQMKLIPADNMKDKLWGKRGYTRARSHGSQAQRRCERLYCRRSHTQGSIGTKPTQNSLVSVSGCSVLRFQSWRKVQVLSHCQQSVVYSKLWVSQQPPLIWVLQARLRCGKMTVRLCNLGRIV